MGNGEKIKPYRQQVLCDRGCLLRTEDFIRKLQQLHGLVTAGYKSKKDKKRNLQKHHIVPKTCGGEDSAANLCYISKKEHILLHKLIREIDCKNLFEMGFNGDEVHELLNKM